MNRHRTWQFLGLGLVASAGLVLALTAAAQRPSARAARATDHGSLGGLADDDHPQYLLANGVRRVTDGFAVTGRYGLGRIPATGAGTRLMWYAGKGAFRAGYVDGAQWDDANIGLWSTALGWGNTASGYYSTAVGFGNTASGDESMALGSYASTRGFRGSFVYGDASTDMPVTSWAHNQFVVRAAGGTVFFSNRDQTAGVLLARGGGAWLSVSSRARKHSFRDEDGEAVLGRIATLPIQSWSYKSQDSTIRHLGPTAQDFYAAFRLGESDTTITTTDIDGVALLAAQALERRTRDLQAQLAARDREIADLRQRLERLEGLRGRR